MRQTTTRVTSATRESGAALLAALITMAALTAVAATVFLSSVPAYRGTYQTSAWHEAKLAADAGVDFAMSALQKTVPRPTAYTWPGWVTENGGAVPANYDGIRIFTPPADKLVKSGDGSRPRIVKVEVDIVTRDSNFAQNAWYRIRSTGLANIPTSQMSLDKRDLSLRRMTLKQKHITRTVEVLSRPVYLWEYALKTNGSMVLGGGRDWVIDSYDSRKLLYPDRSVNGVYDSSIAREFGNVASNLPRPLTSPYGMLIDAEGARVRGEVQTRGGDNPDTPEVHENVEEADKIDPTRITDEYSEDLVPESDPLWYTNYLAKQNPTVGVDYDKKYDNTRSPGDVPSGVVGGPNGSSGETPYRVVMNAQGNQSIGGFKIVNTPPGSLNERFVDIYVNGNIDLNGSTIQVEKGVHVNIYLNGDLNFRNQDINYTSNEALRAQYSMVPGDLLIYGRKPEGATPAPKVESAGNGHIVAAFYGPQYAGHLDGNSEIMGSFVLKTYDISGGGGSGGDSLGAGFHYDEALGVVGPVKYYKSVSYFEDFRKDLE
jgi:hypothetical protein